MYIHTMLKSPPKIAAFSAFVTGIVTHGFALTNILNNYDSITVQPAGVGAGVMSGRWGLQLYSDLMLDVGLAYNIPFINGLLFLLLLSIAAGLLVSIYEVKTGKFAVCIGMIFTVFPTVTASLFFSFTVIPYGIAIVLSVYAVWCYGRYKFGPVLSILCNIVSLSVYQAYIPITISLFVVLLLKEAISGRSFATTVVKKGIGICISLLFSVAAYLLLVKVFLQIYDVTLLDYQGMSSMGKISLSEIPELLIRCYKSVIQLPFHDYGGLAYSKLLRIAYFITYIGFFVTVLTNILINNPRKDCIFLAILLIAVLPIALNFIVFMSPNSTIYTLMLYSFVTIPCLPLVFLEQIMPSSKTVHSLPVLAKSAVSLISAIILLYVYAANVNYTALHYANHQASNYFNSIVTQVRMTEGYTADKKWALLGSVQDPTFLFTWWTGVTYGGNITADQIFNSYSRLSWFLAYTGYNIPTVSDEEITELIHTDEVKTMPCWPDNGSIRVIEDNVVIKFQELSIY